MTPVRAVLFDLDGTLVNSDHVAATALATACWYDGIEGDPLIEPFLAMSGLPLEEIIARLGLPEQIASTFRSEAAALVGLTQLFPGVLPLLRSLRVRGVRIGVITGKDRARTEAVLDHLLIAELVEAVVTPDDPPAAKPSPEGVWWLCDQLGVRPEQTVLVGDAVTDMQAGAGAGVPTIACLWGTGKPDALARCQPWRTVGSVDELTELLQASCATVSAPARPQSSSRRPDDRGCGEEISSADSGDHMFNVRISVPGSKSITNRALFLAAAADGETMLRRPLVADDTQACAAALGALGYAIDTSALDAWHVRGCPAGPPNQTAQIFTRDGATGARFLPALAATGHGTYHFDASEQMRRRPMALLLHALRQLGADIDADALPYTMHATGLTGGRLLLDAGISSQYLTALLLAGPLTRDGLTVEVTRLVSAPYIDITLRLMKVFGATVEGDGNTFHVAPGGYASPGELEVEPDASTASYFLAAAAITGKTLTIPGLGSGSAQGDLAFAQVLADMGAKLDLSADELTLTGPDRLSGITVDLHDFSDTMPTLAAIAPLADGPVRITNIYNTRVKECDRLQTCADNLTALGIAVQTGEDWIQINPGRPRAGRVLTRRDHRIAMAFSVLGLRVAGLELDDPHCVIKTCPTFHELLAELTTRWGVRM